MNFYLSWVTGKEGILYGGLWNGVLEGLKHTDMYEYVLIRSVTANSVY